MAFHYKKISKLSPGFREQMRQIKYSVIEKRPPGIDLTETEKLEYKKLWNFMLETSRGFTNTKAHDKPTIIPNLYVPVMVIKIKTFIKENCPGYASRLKK